MIKTLAGSIRQYKMPAMITMLLMVAEVTLEILIPLMMGNLIDFGIEQGEMGQVMTYGVVLLGFTVLQLASGVGSALFSAKAGAGFAGNLRQDLYDSVQGFSFVNIDKFSTASIVTRLTTDVTNVQQAYQMSLRMIIRAPLMLVLAVVFSFRISVEISTLFLIAVPVLGIGLFFVMRAVHPLFRKVFKTYDKLNGVVQENLHGIRVVKSFNREHFEIEKFGAISRQIYQLFSKAERLVILIFPMMQFCIYALMIGVCWMGASAVVASGNDPTVGLTTGQLTALLSYQMQILMSLMMLAMVFSMLIISQASAERIAQVLKEEAAIQNPEEPVTKVKDGSIRFEKVSFQYSEGADKQVLSGIDLEIPSGQTVGILGGTGSSKTSLVQLIARLYDVTEGSVKVGGVDVRAYDLDTLRHDVSMVLQKNELFSGTIAENLRWGNEAASQEELEAVCKMVCAHDFIADMPEGYDTHIEQGGTNVSGGQKQRICIARALLKKPKILILDDSTSAVDTRTDGMIQAAFGSFIPETTKLIIAQRVSSVAHADQILVMENGRIRARGTHRELLSSDEVYKEVYESQRKGGDELDG